MQSKLTIKHSRILFGCAGIRLDLYNSMALLVCSIWYAY